MPPIDLDGFQHDLAVRPLTLPDYDGLVRLQKAGYTEVESWTREQFESQLRLFPEGQIAVEYNGAIFVRAQCRLLFRQNQFLIGPLFRFQGEHKFCCAAVLMLSIGHQKYFR